MTEVMTINKKMPTKFWKLEITLQNRENEKCVYMDRANQKESPAKLQSSKHIQESETPGRSGKRRITDRLCDKKTLQFTPTCCIASPNAISFLCFSPLPPPFHSSFHRCHFAFWSMKSMKWLKQALDLNIRVLLQDEHVVQYYK